MSEETIPQMREQIDSLTSDLEKARTTVGDLTKDNRRLLARDVAREQGYDAKTGELFANSNPSVDVTAEALDAFVQEYPGLGKAASGDETGGEAPAEGGDQTQGGDGTSPDLSQMSRGGSRPGDSAGGATQEMMTRQDWQALHANDPIAAQEAVRQGRVEISSGNPWGDAKSVAAGTNPYAVQE
jgi:hypothetical protein